MRKQVIQVGIHPENENGDIITVINRFGLRIKWNSKEFVIPRYFESDGASVPRFLWDSVSPQVHPKTIRASLAHDYIYRVQPDGWTREEADRMFYDLMVKDGFPKCKAWIAYKGVVWFGGSAWKNAKGGA